MMPGYVWEDCPFCKGTGNFEYDTCRACMGEGGRWIPQPMEIDEADHSEELDN